MPRPSPRPWLLAGTLLLLGCPPPPSSAPAAQPGAVSFHVRSTPAGAALSVDGIPRGETPARVALPPGLHRVRLSRAGYFDLESAVDVPASGGSFEGALVASH